MALKQLTVFLENKEGHLNDVLKTLADNDVNIIVAALAESADFGIWRKIHSRRSRLCNCKSEIIENCNTEVTLQTSFTMVL